MNIYCLRDDGTWARFQSEDGTEQNRLSAYRGYFKADASAAHDHAAALPGTYKTLFQMTNQQGSSSGESINYDNLDYEGNIPLNGAPTGIQPTIRAINGDGTSLYFDLQGRLLNGKSDKRLIIKNGKKVINR